MDTTLLNREDLLVKLQRNREHHEVEYNEAKATWLKKATKALKKAAKKAEEKGVIDERVLDKLPRPVSYLSSYDDAIARVESDMRPELELDDRQFSAWVQDNWQWRGAFAANTSLYNG